MHQTARKRRNRGHTLQCRSSRGIRADETKKRTKGNACRLTPHTPPAPSPPVRGPGRGGVVGKASHVDAPKSAQS